jgi:hypothetical protein
VKRQYDLCVIGRAFGACGRQNLKRWIFFPCDFRCKPTNVIQTEPHDDSLSRSQ